MHVTMTPFLLTLLLVSSIVGTELRRDEGNIDYQHLATNCGFIHCKIWHALEDDPSELLAKTSKPPCHVPTTFPRILPGGWSGDSTCDSEKQPNTCSLHAGAYCCYRNALKHTESGAQACYDESGQWIVDP